MDQRPEAPVRDPAGELCHHRLHSLGAVAAEGLDVDEGERHRAEQRLPAQAHAARGLDLADLDEPAEAGEALEAALEKRTCEGVEHDVDPSPAGHGLDLVGEAERARVERDVYSQGAQKLPLLRAARRGKDARAAALRNL